ncbi:MerR family transcriptional regulator [Microbacterium sp.]|uniref:MerR family transcriptional regulator n=1 Tax=Microbacterium sp. TaxID=51671 RepID=UPI002810E22F|nr:MerR family transcriptional regulator [Microbacterium sp.]
MIRAGELASRAGVNPETIRYYERRGLLGDPERTLGGHRTYDENAVTLLRVIKAAQGLGFTLDEIEELIDAGTHAHRRRPRLAERAKAKLGEVESKVQALEQIAGTLREVIASDCDDLEQCALEDNCPIPFAGIAGVGDGETPDRARAGATTT